MSSSSETVDKSDAPMSNDTPSTNSKKRELQLVPESVLKRRHNRDEVRARKTAHALIAYQNKKRRKANKNPNDAVILPPEYFCDLRLSRRSYERRYKRVAKKGMQRRASDKKERKTKIVKVKVPSQDGKYMKEEEQERTYWGNSVGAKMVFVVRIRKMKYEMPFCVRDVLHEFRLADQYEGVFVKYTEENRKKLHMIEPFVVYGPPTKAIVKDLITRRGHGMVNPSTKTKDDDTNNNNHQQDKPESKSESKNPTTTPRYQRMPLSDNIIIETTLGPKTDQAVICTEDMVHELVTVGPYFDVVAQFLWPFHMTEVKSHYQKKQLHEGFGARDEYGDRGELIDEVIQLML